MKAFGVSMKADIDKITNIRNVYYIYITNTAQAGKKLVIYYEIKKRWGIY